jgi:hypothetical protein
MQCFAIYSEKVSCEFFYDTSMNDLIDGIIENKGNVVNIEQSYKMDELEDSGTVLSRHEQTNTYP